jgi:hypothetical protein
MHVPRHHAAKPHTATWHPPKEGAAFIAAQAALLKHTGLRLQAARSLAERLKLGGDFWLVADRADRHHALHVADSLQAICTWARCPMPETTNKRAAP